MKGGIENGWVPLLGIYSAFWLNGTWLPQAHVLNSWTSEGDDVERPGAWLVEGSHWVTGNEEIFLPHFLF